MDESKVRASARAGVPPGTRLNGIYEIETAIAAGGMGEVYKAHNIQTGDPLAIKLVLPEHARNEDMLALFRREASMLHNLYHEAIVRYYVFTVDPDLGRAYLAMEYVDGPSLSDVLRQGPLPLESVRLLQRRLAGALEAAHQRGVVHRDLSPDNVILPDGDVRRAKIIDFGIARSTRPGDATIIGGGFAGKYNYVSPEQLGLFGGEVTGKSDIYSLGLLLAGASRGRPIDMDGSQFEVIEKRRQVPDLSGIDPEMRPLLEAMLQPDPAARPSGMAEVAAWGAEPATGWTVPPTAPPAWSSAPLPPAAATPAAAPLAMPGLGATSSSGAGAGSAPPTGRGAAATGSAGPGRGRTAEPKPGGGRSGLKVGVALGALVLVAGAGAAVWFVGGEDEERLAAPAAPPPIVDTAAAPPIAEPRPAPPPIAEPSASPPATEPGPAAAPATDTAVAPPADPSPPPAPLPSPIAPAAPGGLAAGDRAEPSPAEPRQLPPEEIVRRLIESMPVQPGPAQATGDPAPAPAPAPAPPTAEGPSPMATADPGRPPVAGARPEPQAEAGPAPRATADELRRQLLAALDVEEAPPEPAPAAPPAAPAAPPVAVVEPPVAAAPVVDPPSTAAPSPRLEPPVSDAAPALALDPTAPPAVPSLAPLPAEPPPDPAPAPEPDRLAALPMAVPDEPAAPAPVEPTPAPDGEGGGNRPPGFGTSRVAALPAEVGRSYVERLPKARDPDGDEVSITVAGDVPPGLSVLWLEDGSVQLGGIATTAGDYTFTIVARDGEGAAARLPVTLAVRETGIAPIRMLPQEEGPKQATAPPPAAPRQDSGAGSGAAAVPTPPGAAPVPGPAVEPREPASAPSSPPPVLAVTPEVTPARPPPVAEAPTPAAPDPVVAEADPAVAPLPPPLPEPPSLPEPPATAAPTPAEPPPPAEVETALLTPPAAPDPVAPDPPPTGAPARLSLHDYLGAFDGGPCFFARPLVADIDAARIEGFGTEVEGFVRLEADVIRDYGSEPRIDVRMVEAGQCPAVDFMHAIGHSAAKTPLIELETFEVGPGRPLAGRIGGITDGALTVLLVGNDGSVVRLDRMLRPAGDGAAFSIPLQADAASAGVPQLLMAIVTDRPLSSLPESGPASEVFPALAREIRDGGRSVVLDAEMFRIGG